MDAYATADEIVISAAVPGIKPEDVEITYEGDTLTIKGEFPGALENVEYLMHERRHGSFVRTVTFNVPVNADAIEATFEHGVLTIVAPKVEEIKPKTIKVLAKKLDRTRQAGRPSGRPAFCVQPLLRNPKPCRSTNISATVAAFISSAGQFFSAAARQAVPTATLRRIAVNGVPGIVFKGSGWYVTDSRKSGAKSSSD